MDTLPLSLNGYTDLPPGKIADVVTYFELTAPPPNMTRDAPSGLSVRHVVEPSVAWFRDIYRRIGEDWLWFGAAMMSDTPTRSAPRKRISVWSFSAMRFSSCVRASSCGGGSPRRTRVLSRVCERSS
jgi:hypothetical protein